MDEREFWGRLEFRLCSELKGMPEKWQRRYWCDGFEPEHYAIESHPARISGRAWMVDGRTPQKWKFVLLLPQPYKSRESVKWEALLPPENVTCWLTAC